VLFVALCDNNVDATITREDIPAVVSVRERDVAATVWCGRKKSYVMVPTISTTLTEQKNQAENNTYLP